MFGRRRTGPSCAECAKRAGLTHRAVAASLRARFSRIQSRMAVKIRLTRAGAKHLVREQKEWWRLSAAISMILKPS